MKKSVWEDRLHELNLKKLDFEKVLYLTAARLELVNKQLGEARLEDAIEKGVLLRTEVTKRLKDIRKDIDVLYKNEARLEKKRYEKEK